MTAGAWGTGQAVTGGQGATPGGHPAEQIASGRMRLTLPPQFDYREPILLVLRKIIPRPDKCQSLFLGRTLKLPGSRIRPPPAGDPIIRLSSIE